MTPTPNPKTIAEFLAPMGSPGFAPRLIAHRGFSGRAPENTLAAFELALEFGAPMIEFDVTLSRDGEVVVIHDDTLDRTTTGKGPVSALTLAELRALDAGSWFSPAFAGQRIPTLAETLDLIGDRALVNIEIKEEAVVPLRGMDPGPTCIEAQVARIVNERGPGQVARTIISSFEPLALARLLDLAPEIATAALYNSKLQTGHTPRAILRSTGARCFNLSSREVTPAIVEACRAAGAPVFVYTVNDAATFRRLAVMGVHGVFTDRPDILTGS